MSRRRHKKKTDKKPASVPPPPNRPAARAAMRISKALAGGESGDMKDILIRVLVASGRLAEESEFADLQLDTVQADRVSARWLEKFADQLDQAAEQSPDAYQIVFDEMRMEIIAELATPQFRQEVLDRLARLRGRLLTGKDSRKLETVLLLEPLLEMESTPWGLCGLILAIYGQAMNTIKQEFEADQRMYDALATALNVDSLADLDPDTLLEEHERIETAAQQAYSANPGMRDHFEKQIWKLITDFEHQLLHGNVELNLFSLEELVLPLERFQTKAGEPEDFGSLTDEMRSRLFDTVRQSLKETMTPERYRRFCEDVKQTAEEWWRARRKWAAALQAERGYLDGGEYEENKFVLAVFLNQFGRLTKEDLQRVMKNED